MKTGIEIISEERERQISVEGWSPEHDDAHTNEELVQAAVKYALPKGNLWPAAWSIDWYKPTPEDRIKELAKAGALIAAEIDRLRRSKTENTKEMKKYILGTIEDLVTDFVYYGRKEDEDLPVGAIEKSVAAGEVTLDEMVEVFKTKLEKSLKQ